MQSRRRDGSVSATPSLKQRPRRLITQKGEAETTKSRRPGPSAHPETDLVFLFAAHTGDDQLRGSNERDRVRCRNADEAHVS